VHFTTKKNLTQDSVNKYLIGTNVTLQGYYMPISGMDGYTTVITSCNAQALGYSSTKPTIFTQIINISSGSLVNISILFSSLITIFGLLL